MTEVRSAQYISAGEISLSRERIARIARYVKNKFVTQKLNSKKHSQVNFISDIRIYIHKKNTVFNNK